MKIKMIRVVLLLSMLFSISCSENLTSNEDKPLLVRVKRKSVINYLLKSDVNFYQQGQTITLIVPSRKLFKPLTTVSLIRSDGLLKDISEFVNSYRTERVSVESHIVGSESAIDRDYAEAQSQIVQDALIRNGLKAPIIISKGYSDSDYRGSFGLQNRNYIKIQFRFLKILV